jgi:hypothetical protein
MRNRILVLIAIAALGFFTLVPEPAEAQRGGFRGGGMGGFRGGGMGGFRGASIGGFRGGAIGFRGGAFRGAGVGWRGGGLGFRRAGLGWGGGVGWRRAGLGWGGPWRRPFWGYGAAAVVGAGLLASSYGYGYSDDYGPAGYGYGGYGGCVVEPRLVVTNWGYQRVLVQVCY